MAPRSLDLVEPNAARRSPAHGLCDALHLAPGARNVRNVGQQHRNEFGQGLHLLPHVLLPVRNDQVRGQGTHPLHMHPLGPTHACGGPPPIPRVHAEGGQSHHLVPATEIEEPLGPAGHQTHNAHAPKVRPGQAGPF